MSEEEHEDESLLPCTRLQLSLPARTPDVRDMLGNRGFRQTAGGVPYSEAAWAVCRPYMGPMVARPGTRDLSSCDQT